MSTRRYLTPSGLPGFACRAIMLPTGPGWAAIVSGAFAALCSPHSYEDHGTYTPEETAAEFETLFASWIDSSQCAQGGAIQMPVGMIFDFAGTTPPDGCLLCNGAEHDIDDYPELYGVIGDTYGGDGVLTFAVPDCRARFRLGIGPSENQIDFYDLAEVGGSETHTLSEEEIPAHDHSVSGAANWTVAAGQTATVTKSAAGTYTGDAGGGEPHNNMPPFIALTPCIVAE